MPVPRRTSIDPVRTANKEPAFNVLASVRGDNAMIERFCCNKWNWWLDFVKSTAVVLGCCVLECVAVSRFVLFVKLIP